MISYLRGIARDVDDEALVLDVQGVGYLVQCSSRTLSVIGGSGEVIELFIKTQVRDDDISLFGFSDAYERAWFTSLQRIQGVGARLALAILSTLRPDELLTAVAAQDRKALTRVNGVGPRLAARIVSELESKQPVLAGVAAPDPNTGSPLADHRTDDVISALVNLGYSRSDAFSVVHRTLGTVGRDQPFDELLRKALQEIAT